MPISRRDRVIHTSKVKKHDKCEKSDQIEVVRESVAASQYVYLVEVSNDRNNILKAIRDEIKPGKLFYSKNKLLQVALGITSESECAQGIHGLTPYLTGHCGMICTNMEQSDLSSLLEQHETTEFARTGDVAIGSVMLDAGFDALAQYPHSMEVQFRKLGLPTMLYDGKIKMLSNHYVCKEGDVLLADQAHLLKMLRVPMGKFQMKIKAVYDKATETVSVM